VPAGDGLARYFEEMAVPPRGPGNAADCFCIRHTRRLFIRMHFEEQLTG
jgi:hypothetical protein